MSGGPEMLGLPDVSKARPGMISPSQSTSSLRDLLPQTNFLSRDEQPKSVQTAKRESKLTLRNIFGRQKAKRDVVVPEIGSAQLESPTSPVAGPSMAGTRHWPYAADGSMSKSSLQCSTKSLDQPALQPMLSGSNNGEGTGDYRVKKRATMSGHERSHGSAAAMPWPPPPLCQAYQQSVKHAMMSMCTVPMETLQRLSPTTTRPARQSCDPADLSKRSEPRRKLNRSPLGRNSFDFKSKIYVLTNSSWLFQYAADGDTDRPPERALRISKNSAAFASDLIPGRHWVIQVLALADAATSGSTDSKGRKKSKGADKHQVSTFLLICETPEDMESWLAVLRHEIEIMGGRKKAPETGEIEIDDSRDGGLPTHEQYCYSQIVREDFAWTQENALSMDKLDRTPDLLQDDGSTTGSIDSSERNSLDNLRDSTGNRFSAASIELRAFGTSPQSSPGCSPTHLIFQSNALDTPDIEHSPNSVQSISELSGIRVRPNAAAILSRRESQQAGNADMHKYNVHEPRQSVDSRSSMEHEYVSAPQSIPNFSIPHAVSRRFSAPQTQTSAIALSPSSLPSSPQPTPSPKDLFRPLRKAPPTSLPLSRPLSTVMDLPSPVSPNLSTVASRAGASNQASEQLPSLDSQLHAPLLLLPSPSEPRIDSKRDMEHAQGLSPTCGYFGFSESMVQRVSMAVSFHHPNNYPQETTGEPCSLDAALQAASSPTSAPIAAATLIHEPRTSSLAAPRTLSAKRSTSTLDGMPPPVPPPTYALPPIPPLRSTSIRATRRAPTASQMATA